MKRILFLACCCMGVLLLDACCPTGQIYCPCVRSASVTIGQGTYGGQANFGAECRTPRDCVTHPICGTGAEAPLAPEGEIIQMPADYHRKVSLLERFAKAVEGGTESTGGGIFCAPVCGPDPGSQDCLDCRTAVSAAEVAPFVNYCAGGAFVLPPDSTAVAIRVATDTGTFDSQPIRAFRRRGSVRYDDCGSPTQADYELDQGAARDFADYVMNVQHARAVYSSSIRQASGAGALFRLDPSAKELILAGKADQLGAGALDFGFSAWVFTNGGGDPTIGRGAPDGMLMVDRRLTGAELFTLANGGDVVITGGGRIQLKPCSTEDDCSPWGLTCRADDSGVGLVCVAP